MGICFVFSFSRRRRHVSYPFKIGQELEGPGNFDFEQAEEAALSVEKLAIVVARICLGFLRYYFGSSLSSSAKESVKVKNWAQAYSIITSGSSNIL